MSAVCVYIGEELARYGFGHGHPFGPDRMGAFWQAAQSAGLESRITVRAPVMADRDSIDFVFAGVGVERDAGPDWRIAATMDLTELDEPGTTRSMSRSVRSLLLLLRPAVASSATAGPKV